MLHSGNASIAPPGRRADAVAGSTPRGEPPGMDFSKLSRARRTKDGRRHILTCRKNKASQQQCAAGGPRTHPGSSCSHAVRGRASVYCVLLSASLSAATPVAPMQSHLVRKAGQGTRATNCGTMPLPPCSASPTLACRAIDARWAEVLAEVRLSASRALALALSRSLCVCVFLSL